MSAANPKLFMGIDFGTTKSVMSWYDQSIRRADIIRNRERLEETPSVVYLAKNEEENLIGVLAERRLEDPKAEQNRFVVSVKRYLQGPDDIPIRRINDKNVYPIEVAAKIFRRLKDDAEKTHFINFSNQPVSSVVVTYPASFDQFQQAKIKRAAELAGFTEVTLLPEPIAAAIAYSTIYEQMGAMVGNNILVYDFGGGTFDVAVLARNSGNFVLASRPEGLIDCGGDDLDRELYDYCDEIARQILKPGRGISMSNDLDLRFLHECRKRKENLSGENVTSETFSSYLLSQDGAVLFEHTVQRTVFEERIYKHIARTVTLTQEVLNEATSGHCNVDTVVLIGGSSSVPLVLRSLSNSLPAQPIAVKEWQQRDFAVALGAAYHAQKLWGHQSSIFYPPPPQSPPPPPPPGELYRGALMTMWGPTRRLTQNQITELTALANRLGLSREIAAAIERYIMRYTKEELQHYAALGEYRTAVARAWQTMWLSWEIVDYLVAETNRLGLSKDEASAIERELMKDTKEAILSHQISHAGNIQVSQPPQVTQVVQVQKWRFTAVKIIPLLLFLFFAFLMLGASSAPESLIVTVPLALLNLWWFLRKPRVKITIPPSSTPQSPKQS